VAGKGEGRCEADQWLKEHVLIGFWEDWNGEKKVKRRKETPFIGISYLPIRSKLSSGWWVEWPM